MPEMRKVAVVDGTGRVHVADRSCPEPEAGEILVDVKASAISPGTIASVVRRRRENADPDQDDQILGYQNAGDVVAVGEGVERFRPGDRVACTGAGYALHASHAVVPMNLCTHLPEGVTYEEGAFNHLAATGLHAVRRGEVSLGEYVAVMGLGLVGQFTAQLAQASGAHALGVDLIDSRVEIARTTGTECAISGDTDPVTAAEEFTQGRGIDCGVIAFGGDGTGAAETLVQMASRAPDGHEHGRIVVVGGVTLELDYPVPLGNMDVRASSRPGPGYHDEAWERGAEYTHPYVRWTTRRNLEEVVRLVDEGRLDVEELITHRIPFVDISTGYDALVEDEDDALGVVIKQ